MSAFRAMLAALHADANIGSAADFRRPPYPWVPARVVLASPNDVLGGLGGIGSWAGRRTAEVLASDIAPLEPRRGDELRIGAVIHRVEDAERDPLGLSWRITLAEG